MNVEQVASAFGMIFTDAFTETATTRGFTGAAVARGVFSNEAGLGSGPIAHAAARTRDPIRPGLVGMLGPLSTPSASAP